VISAHAIDQLVHQRIAVAAQAILREAQRPPQETRARRRGLAREEGAQAARDAALLRRAAQARRGRRTPRLRCREPAELEERFARLDRVPVRIAAPALRMSRSRRHASHARAQARSACPSARRGRAAPAAGRSRACTTNIPPRAGRVDVRQWAARFREDVRGRKYRHCGAATWRTGPMIGIDMRIKISILHSDRAA